MSVKGLWAGRLGDFPWSPRAMVSVSQPDWARPGEFHCVVTLLLPKRTGSQKIVHQKFVHASIAEVLAAAAAWVDGEVRNEPAS